jgi:hypothetical protein
LGYFELLRVLGRDPVIDRILRRLTAIPEIRALWRRLPIGSVELRTQYSAWPRPAYAYGVFAAAQQASLLGMPAISVIEFGVAGGNGVLALEALAEEMGQHFGIAIAVFGFDTGEGMPQPTDYRDLPHVWSGGFYKMDPEKLRQRLRPATQLILGDVSETIPQVVRGIDPIGFIAFDLDYYSSTKAAFRIFEFSHSGRLPRVYCYFDDIMWPEWACHNEYIGELCAIREFNQEHVHLKLSPIHLLREMRPHAEPWNDQMYVMHDFKHPYYCANLTLKRKVSVDTQKALRKK